MFYRGLRKRIGRTVRSRLRVVEELCLAALVTLGVTACGGTQLGGPDASDDADAQPSDAPDLDHLAVEACEAGSLDAFSGAAEAGTADGGVDGAEGGGPVDAHFYDHVVVEAPPPPK